MWGFATYGASRTAEEATKNLGPAAPNNSLYYIYRS